MSRSYESGGPGKRLTGAMRVVNRMDRSDGETRKTATEAYIKQRVEIELRHSRTDDFQDAPARVTAQPGITAELAKAIWDSK